MHAPGPILLQTSNLSVGYGSHVLLENLDLTLNAGNLICFMGPNGIGKSTLIRTLSGLQKQLHGDIKLLSTGEVPRQVAVVLTDRISASNMTVSELLAFGRYPYLNWNVKLTNEDHSRIENAIEQVNLQKLIGKQLYELSDGQLQMVMIARALAQDTPIIILDEPTAHLDLNNRVEIMKLLRGLALKTNKAILVATHELDLALQMADEIWLTGKTKNIITGIPEDLVLNGTFDDIFQFKGFDLKTGKVKQEPYLGKTIRLTGEGFEYLWTKNALERNGFEVIHSDEKSEIYVTVDGRTIHWTMGDRVFNSIRELLSVLILQI